MGNHATGGQPGVLAVVYVAHGPPVAVQDTLGAVGFVIAEFDSLRHRFELARLVLNLGEIHGPSRVVVHANQLLVGRAQELAKGVVINALLEAPERVVVRLARGVAAGAAVDEECGAADPAVGGQVGEIIYRAYRRRDARAVSGFEIDCASGQAVFSISTLPSGDRYQDARNELLDQISGLVSIAALQSVHLGPAASAMDGDQTIMSRQIRLQTRRGGDVNMTSSGRRQDLRRDPDLNQVRALIRSHSVPMLSNFHVGMVQEDESVEHVHVKIYIKDHRVGLFGQMWEREVRDVLSRVWGHCR